MHLARSGGWHSIGSDMPLTLLRVHTWSGLADGVTFTREAEFAVVPLVFYQLSKFSKHFSAVAANKYIRSAWKKYKTILRLVNEARREYLKEKERWTDGSMGGWMGGWMDGIDR